MPELLKFLYFYKKLLLLRNHGLKNRDEVEFLAYNSRLDTFQAVVGSWLIKKIKNITNKRIQNAKYFDNKFKNINQIKIPHRNKDQKIVSLSLKKAHVQTNSH